MRLRPLSNLHDRAWRRMFPRTAPPQAVAAAPSFYLHEYFPLRSALERARSQRDYWRGYEIPEPLVSVCVGTYNRAALLLDRCIPSILGQDYKNLEVIVVGDACTDDTFERLAAISDPRLRTCNLRIRGPYPPDPFLRWMVAGTASVNHALALAHGDFITHLDDDDEYLPGRISTLVRLAQQERAELVHHPFHSQLPDGRWEINDEPELRRGAVTTSSIFYHCWLRRIRWDPRAYRYRLPGDWHRIAKMRRLGIRVSRHPAPWLRHYRERANSE